MVTPLDSLRVLLRVALELSTRKQRIITFLASLEEAKPEAYRPLVLTAKTALERLDNLVPEALATLEKIVDDQSQITHQQVDLLFRELEKYSRWFTTLHELLVFFPHARAAPETTDLLSSAFGCYYEEEAPSIVLGTLFNALEFDFVEIVRRRLPDFSDVALADDRNIVLQLAICDRDAPSTWAILAHELGHALDHRNSISRRVTRQFVTDEASEPFQLLSSWAQEFFADLVAARVLGPAPLLALISLEYCFFPQVEVFTPSRTHPSTRWRIKVLQDYLRSRFRRTDYLGSEPRQYEVAARYSLERRVSGSKRRDRIRRADNRDFDTLVRPLVESLLVQLAELDLPETPMNRASLDRCKRRFSQGLPAAAQGTERKSLRSKIRKYKKLSFTTEEDRQIAFDHLVTEFKELPLPPQTILTSTLERRIDYINAELSSLLRLGDRDRLRTFTERLDRLEELAEASLRMSQIQSQLESAACRSSRF